MRMVCAENVQVCREQPHLPATTARLRVLWALQRVKRLHGRSISSRDTYVVAHLLPHVLLLPHHFVCKGSECTLHAVPVEFKHCPARRPLRAEAARVIKAACMQWHLATRPTCLLLQLIQGSHRHARDGRSGCVAGAHGAHDTGTRKCGSQRDLAIALHLERCGLPTKSALARPDSSSELRVLRSH
jgi:hypothetical protein